MKLSTFFIEIICHITVTVIASVEAVCQLPDLGRNEKAEECQSTWEFIEGGMINLPTLLLTDQ